MKWTDEEINHLKYYYPIGGSKLSSKYIKKSLSAIRCKANSLGLKCSEEACKQIRQAWTEEDDNVIRKAFPHGGAHEVQNNLKTERSLTAIYTRAKILGVNKDNFKYVRTKARDNEWTDEEDSILCRFYPVGGTNLVREHLKNERSPRAITKRCNSLGIKYIGKDGALSNIFAFIGKYWDYSLNAVSPDEVGAHSNKNVWLKCPCCGNSWKIKADRLTSRKVFLCPKCNRIGASNQEMFCTNIFAQFAQENLVRNARFLNNPILKDGKEFDAIDSAMKITMEFNGYPWHNDKVFEDNYKVTESLKCGYTPIVILDKKSPWLDSQKGAIFIRMNYDSEKPTEFEMKTLASKIINTLIPLYGFVPPNLSEKMSYSYFLKDKNASEKSEKWKAEHHPRVLNTPPITMNDGSIWRIKEYYNANNITIVSNYGDIKGHQKWQRFYIDKNIGLPYKNPVGEKYYGKRRGHLIIVKYVNAKKAYAYCKESQSLVFVNYSTFKTSAHYEGLASETEMKAIASQVDVLYKNVS